jgi:hypothetical protein
MATFEKHCDIRCDTHGRYSKVVYSTDPLACPTFLHMHDPNGSCIPEQMSTSSLIIKHQVPTTQKWEYFYLTASLCIIDGHHTEDARDYRPMRLGRCVPVGMRISYPINFDEEDDEDVENDKKAIELVHVHKHTGETQEAFDQRMSAVSDLRPFPPVSLSSLDCQLPGINEIKTPYNRQRERQVLSIARYQDEFLIPTSSKFMNDGIRSYWEVAVGEVEDRDRKLTGSDLGSLVYGYSRETNTTDGKFSPAVGKRMGIVDSFKVDNQGRYVTVRLWSFVIEVLEERFRDLFDR